MSRFGSDGGSRFSASPQPTETDYAAQNLLGITKVMSVNPELGQKMLGAYQNKTQPSTGLLSGLWNAVSSPAKGLIGALGNITSSFAEPFRNESDQEEGGDPFYEDFWQGLSGQENTTWRDNLLSYGWEDNFSTTAVGLMGDIFLDPTTYLGAGMLGKAGSTVAKTGQELAEFGAKKALLTEIAAKGGLEFGGRFISKADDFATVTKDLTEEALKKVGVSDEVVAGLAGNTAAQAERTVIGTLDALAQKSYESVGRIVGDAIIQRKSIKALPEQIVDDIGRTWKKADLIKIFEDTRKLGSDDLVKLGNEVYGTALSGTQGLLRYQQLGRSAAAAQGGIRLKFGVPFGERLAKNLDTPWLAYRWQTGALPYANRFKFGKGLKINGKLVEEEVSFTKVGDFFRGLSGINRLDTAIQKSLVEGGVWSKEHMSLFLRNGFGGESGLRARMMQGTMEEKRAFQEVFGNKAVSTFIPMSQRVGAFTSAITPGAQMWRRGGMIGLRTADGLRNAKNSKRVFRSFAATDEESWTKAATRFDKEAAANQIDAEAINLAAIRYLERLTDDLTEIPDYLHDPIKAMRDKYPGLLEKARGMGAEVGDITEVYAMHRAMMVVDEAEKRLAKLEGSVAGVSDIEKVELQELILKTQAQMEDAQEAIKQMDEYENTIARLRGERVAEKLGPRNYFHRRLTSEARAALIGSPVAGTKTFNKAKVRAAATERLLATKSFEEAQQLIARKYPELKKVKKIFEDNPFRVYAHYVEDIAEEVYKANLGKQARFVMNHLGGVDNGVYADLVPKARANMERTVAAMDAKARGLQGKMHNVVNKFHDDIAKMTGAQLVDEETLRAIPKEMWEDLGMVAKDVPGRWKEGPYAKVSEVIPIQTLRQLREFDRAGLDALPAIKGRPKPTIADVVRDYPEKDISASAENIEKLTKSIQENGFSEPLILIAHQKSGRVYLGEGNHRLAAAERAGLEGVPVRVHVSKGDSAKPLMAGMGPGRLTLKDDLARIEKEGYVSADMKPSDVIPEELMTKHGTIPKLSDKRMAQLENVFDELNKLKAGVMDLKARPEVALKDLAAGIDMRYWGRVDVPGLEGIVMHPFIAAEFNKAWHGTKTNLGGELGKAQQAWRRHVMGPWKKWATIYFPGFHARNAMGAWFNNWIGGVDSRHYEASHKLMDVLSKGKESKHFKTNVAELPEMSLRNVALDGRNGPLTYGELARAMQDTGVYAANSLALADLRLLGSGEEGITYAAKSHRISSKIKVPGTKPVASRYGPVTRAEQFMRGWERLGVNSTGFIENYYRGAAFVKGLEDAAGDVAGARAFTMMRHGDYDELTEVEHTIKDVLPFYKWMRTNFPYQLRNLVENPGKQMATLDLGTAMTDPETRKNLPTWMKESFLIQLPEAIGEKFSGEDAAAFLSLQLPLNDMFLSSEEFASSFLPVVRQVLIENEVFKKNLFTGAPIEGTKFSKVHPFVEFTGLGLVADALGVAQRDADGNLIMNDQWINTMQAFPIFARARHWLFDDPERNKLRTNALVSSFLGVGVRPIGDAELNDAEADYFYNFIEPQVTALREKGYPLPTATDLGMAATQASEGSRF